MPRLRLAALILAGALSALAVACSSGDSTASPTPTGADPATTIVSVEGTQPPAPGESDPPAATVAFGGGGAVPMRIGTYCWGGVCADAIGIITPLAPVAASADDELTFGGSAFAEHTATAGLQLWALPDETVGEGSDWQAWRPETTATALELVDGTATLPGDLAPGRYLLSLFLSFEGGGDASYGIVIEATR